MTTATVLQIGVVTWSSPADPTICWKGFRRWRKPPSAKQIREAQDQGLRDHRFFGWCRVCEKLQNAGHMHEGDVCQGCASRYFQLVY